jgi:hypothetical protein
MPSTPLFYLHFHTELIKLGRNKNEEGEEVERKWEGKEWKEKE